MDVDFLVGEDLDCIMDIIDDDFVESNEEFNLELNELLSDVTFDLSSANFSCNTCDKVYKTKRGLSRHIYNSPRASDIFA
jgi:hypothetical protein